MPLVFDAPPSKVRVGIIKTMACFISIKLDNSDCKKLKGYIKPCIVLNIAHSQCHLTQISESPNRMGAN